MGQRTHDFTVPDTAERPGSRRERVQAGRTAGFKPVALPAVAAAVRRAPPPSRAAREQHPFLRERMD
jgi:hypothetical protein